MSRSKKDSSGFGCASIPFSAIFIILGGGYWLFTQRDNIEISRYFPDNLQENIPFLNSFSLPQNTEPKPPSVPPSSSQNTAVSPTPSDQLPPQQTELKLQTDIVETPQIATTTPPSTEKLIPTPSGSIPTQNTEEKPPQEVAKKTPNITTPSPQTPWEKKAIRGIYLSRYQITNNASEAMIRQRVRYYRDQGINTIIHGVWGNACTMYKSEVMQEKLGYESCPNQFQDQWLNWLIDEAHKQGMEVHAYFEKGIKIDENSPAFNVAVKQGWIVPGIDRTHPGVEHYVLNIANPEVANFFTDIVVEFVTKYPTIDAVQWDDYLGYHAELPGEVDRTPQLTSFVQNMIKSMKAANPNVSFDICHHNPYWAKRYFAADWKTWGVDRVFIQVYGEENFNDELKYVEAHNGISISERQFDRLEELIDNSKVESILFFPLSGKPQEMAETIKSLTAEL
jgi:hypothetical protein